MERFLVKVILATAVLIPTAGHAMYGSPPSNNNPSTNNWFTSPTINLFGDSEFGDTNWDTVGGSSSNTYGSYNPAQSSKDPFGFPDEDIAGASTTPTY